MAFAILPRPAGRTEISVELEARLAAAVRNSKWPLYQLTWHDIKVDMVFVFAFNFRLRLSLTRKFANVLYDLASVEYLRGSWTVIVGVQPAPNRCISFPEVWLEALTWSCVTSLKYFQGDWMSTSLFHLSDESASRLHEGALCMILRWSCINHLYSTTSIPRDSE